MNLKLIRGEQVGVLQIKQINLVTDNKIIGMKHQMLTRIRFLLLFILMTRPDQTDTDEDYLNPPSVGI